MWQVAKATIIRNQLSNLRGYPWSFTFGHIVDGLYVVLLSFFAYHFLIQGQLDTRFQQYAGTNDYLTFAILGGLLSSLAVTMLMNVSRALITEYREGTLEVLLLTPSRRSGYFIGTAIQQLYRVAMEVLPVLFIGVIIGLRVPHANWGAALVGLVVYMAACFAMGLVLGAIMLFTRDTFLVQNTLFSVMMLLCGFQFPTLYLPHLLQVLGNVFPLTGALFLLRDSLLTGTPLWDHPQLLLQVLVLTFVFAIIGMFLIKRAERQIHERYR